MEMKVRMQGWAEREVELWCRMTENDRDPGNHSLTGAIRLRCWSGPPEMSEGGPFCIGQSLNVSCQDAVAVGHSGAEEFPKGTYVWRLSVSTLSSWVASPPTVGTRVTRHGAPPTPVMLSTVLASSAFPFCFSHWHNLLIPFLKSTSKNNYEQQFN